MVEVGCRLNDTGGVLTIWFEGPRGARKSAIETTIYPHYRQEPRPILNIL